MTIKGRPTVYAGIHMRSRLEADFARWLDSHGATWTYEPRCYAGPAGQRLPDFELPGDDVNRLVEVKPDSIEDIDPVLARMATAWLSEPDTLLALVIWKYGTDRDGETHQIHGWRGYWTYVVYQGAKLLGEWAWPGMGQLRATLDEIAGQTS